jgi:hypothetical protein
MITAGALAAASCLASSSNGDEACPCQHGSQQLGKIQVRLEVWGNAMSSLLMSLVYPRRHENRTSYCEVYPKPALTYLCGGEAGRRDSLKS